MQVVHVRVLGFLARRGVIDDTGELGAGDGAFTEREPALAALARASVSRQMLGRPIQTIPLDWSGFRDRERSNLR